MTDTERKALVERLISKAKWLEPELDVLDENTVMTAATQIEADGQRIAELEAVVVKADALCAAATRLADSSEARIAELEAALREFDALIAYQYSSSREAMSALQNAAFSARAALRDKG